VTDDKPRPVGEPFVVKIRVKERIGKSESPARFGSPEKILLLVVGACLGLGLGYLAAGMLVNYLRHPIRTIRASASTAEPVQAVQSPSPAAIDIEFDLPSSKN